MTSKQRSAIRSGLRRAQWTCVYCDRKQLGGKINMGDAANPIPARKCRYCFYTDFKMPAKG